DRSHAAGDQSDLLSLADALPKRIREQQRGVRIDLELLTNAGDVELAQVIAPHQNARVVDQEIDPALADGHFEAFYPGSVRHLDAREDFDAQRIQLRRALAAGREHRVPAP